MQLILLIFFSIIVALKAANGHNLTVICYWPNEHNVSELRPELCTHLHYSFFLLDEATASPVDSLGHYNTTLYGQLNALKTINPSLKIIASIGGWGEAADKYSRVVANDTARQLFVQNAYQLLTNYSFDGFDLDWEFPVCWQDNCTAGDDSDRENFSKLIQELREEFDKNSTHYFSVSAAVKGDEIISSLAYNFTALNLYLDYLSVMTYDDYGYLYGQNVTKHHSAFDYCIETLEFYYIKGVAKNKLLIGVPFYGRSFTLINESLHGIGDPIVPLDFTGTPARDFVEICLSIKSGEFMTGFGNVSDGHDPYAYSGTYWVGYDDTKQIFDKTDFVRINGYGGVILWEVGLDDVHQQCCSIDYPLLRSLNDGLSGIAYDPIKYNCLDSVTTVPSNATDPLTSTVPSDTTTLSSHAIAISLNKFSFSILIAFILSILI